MSFEQKKNIELLAPAGSPEALNAAIGEGADSVYLGLRDFNARIRARNFSYNQFEAVIERLHEQGKKVYVTLNTVFEEREKKQIFNLLKYLVLTKADAVIVQDLGIVYLANKYYPELKLHASTQMNIASTAGVNYLSRSGVKRVVLARELSLDEIKQIRQNTNLELEIFIHGALCVSVSGLCLFSSYFGGKSANRGRCTQACRRMYQTDNQSGYFFSPYDLELIDFIPQIIESGVDSLKIEGRMKSWQYIACVVKAYRYLLDNYSADQEAALIKAKEILVNDFARKKTSYFFERSSQQTENLDFINPQNSGATGIFIGEIIETDEQKIVIGNHKEIELNTNDLLRIQAKNDDKRDTLMVKNVQNTNKQITVSSNKAFNPGDTVYLIQKGDASQKYYSYLPNNLNSYKKHPGINEAPVYKNENLKKPKTLKAGIYAKINDPSQLYILQSDKPEKVIIHLNEDKIPGLINSIKKTNFTSEEIIIYLEPQLFENQLALQTSQLAKLMDNGFNYFICNNLGQLNILKKNKNLILCAGPYLYTFNLYAAGFLLENKITYLISPIENNKRNLYSTIESINPENYLLTVFCFPELFLNFFLRHSQYCSVQINIFASCKFLVKSCSYFK